MEMYHLYLGGGVGSEETNYALVLAFHMQIGTVLIRDWPLLSEQMLFRI